ncbi:hypothetical protein [Vibrio gallaecicus]|uniref:Uncharacterized protein n=1 Tax=Vibrio gallaecicus TaxID=552386 RepID=A0ABV4NGU3_9VIBR
MVSSEYDSRQIAKMKSQLRAFQNGDLSLNRLVADLTFLRDVLESCSVEWELKFTSKLTDLESINSYMIENQTDILDEIVRPIADSAISEILELVNKY